MATHLRLPVLTTNCSNNYGPFHFLEKLIPLVILNALNGKPLPIYGDGQQVRDWLYVKDHCKAIIRVLASGRIGDAYNIGCWNEKTNIYVVKTLCAKLDQLRPRTDNKPYAANGNPFALILGDNIFCGHNLDQLLTISTKKQNGASIFAYHVQGPERYGVVEFNSAGKVLSLEEKLSKPKSSYADTGLYFFGLQAVQLAKSLTPSARSELEITDLNRLYLEKNLLNFEIMGRCYAWLDTGTHESLLKASQFIVTIECRQGLKVSCPEEIAYRKGWIDAAALKHLAPPLKKTAYVRHLINLLKEQVF